MRLKIKGVFFGRVGGGGTLTVLQSSTTPIWICCAISYLYGYVGGVPVLYSSPLQHLYGYVVPYGTYMDMLGGVPVLYSSPLQHLYRYVVPPDGVIILEILI